MLMLTEKTAVLRVVWFVLTSRRCAVRNFRIHPLQFPIYWVFTCSNIVKSSQIASEVKYSVNNGYLTLRAFGLVFDVRVDTFERANPPYKTQDERAVSSITRNAHCSTPAILGAKAMSTAPRCAGRRQHSRVALSASVYTTRNAFGDRSVHLALASLLGGPPTVDGQCPLDTHKAVLRLAELSVHHMVAFEDCVDAVWTVST